MAPRALASREQRAAEHGDEDTLGISASARLLDFLNLELHLDRERETKSFIFYSFLEEKESLKKTKTLKNRKLFIIYKEKI